MAAKTKLFFPLQREFQSGVVRPDGATMYQLQEGFNANGTPVFAPFDGVVFKHKSKAVSGGDVGTWTEIKANLWKGTWGSQPMSDALVLDSSDGLYRFGVSGFVANDDVLNEGKCQAGQVIGTVSPWDVLAFGLSRKQGTTLNSLSMTDPGVQWVFEHEKGIAEEAKSIADEAKSINASVQKGVKDTKSGLFLIGIGALAFYFLVAKKGKKL